MAGPFRRGGHFALQASSDMHRGDDAIGYEVLFLTPKSSGQRFVAL